MHSEYPNYLGKSLVGAGAIIAVVGSFLAFSQGNLPFSGSERPIASLMCTPDVEASPRANEDAVLFITCGSFLE